jgi:hypothetical protein
VVVVAAEWADLGMAPAEQDRDSVWAAAEQAAAEQAGVEQVAAPAEVAPTHPARAQAAARAYGSLVAEAVRVAVVWAPADWVLAAWDPEVEQAVVVAAQELAVEAAQELAVEKAVAAVAEPRKRLENGEPHRQCCVTPWPAECREFLEFMEEQEREVAVAEASPSRKKMCVRCWDCSRNWGSHEKIRNHGWMCRRFNRG